MYSYVRIKNSGRVRLGAGHLRAWTIGREKSAPDYCRFFQIRFSGATLFRFVARFARVRIEDSSRNRFALNGIERIACLKNNSKSSRRMRNVLHPITRLGSQSYCFRLQYLKLCCRVLFISYFQIYIIIIQSIYFILQPTYILYF